MLGLAACEPEPATCEDHKADITGCNRVFRRDVCATPLDRCHTACYATVPCHEWPAIDSGRYPAYLTRCFQKCTAPFTCEDGFEIDARYKCDGFEDCADGSDEPKSCMYFECKSGQQVRESAPCDGYAECRDESDEAGCP